MMPHRLKLFGVSPGRNRCTSGGEVILQKQDFKKFILRVYVLRFSYFILSDF